jgi:hypothetical protein
MPAAAARLVSPVLMAETGWRRPFDDEIALPDGRVLRTLGEAGRYVAALPEKVGKGGNRIEHADEEREFGLSTLPALIVATKPLGQFLALLEILRILA